MDLRTWLFQNHMKVTDFANLLSVHRTYVHLWISGKRKPHKKILSKISEMTMGKVSSFEDLIDKTTVKYAKEETND